MSKENTVVFSYPILDIIAVLLAFLAVCVAVFGIYKSSQIADNTASTVDNVNLTYEEIYKIRKLIETNMKNKENILIK